MPKTGEIVRSALKPIGEVYTSKAIDTNKDQIITASIEPATEEEVRNTVTVMGARTGNCGLMRLITLAFWLMA
jgi:enoyl-[acyl-carrier protein] reductase/trans-2-enoyl-CoA reductase (NAD+)